MTSITTLSEINNGGGRHLEFLLSHVSGMKVKFSVQIKIKWPT